MSTPTLYAIRWNGVSDADQSGKLYRSMTEATIKALSIKEAALATETDAIAHRLLAALTFDVVPVSTAL